MKLEQARRLHFYRRCKERMDRRVDAKAVWKELVENINNPDPEKLVFICRVSRDGLRLWKFLWFDKWHLLLFHHGDGHPVTILQPRGRIYPQGKKRSILLEKHV